MFFRYFTNKSLLLASAFMGCILVSGCRLMQPEPVAATEEPVETVAPVIEITPDPEPELIAIEVHDATPSPEPPPTPTPTPEPTPSPIPFSYYAPTVNMSFEQLVGSTDDMKASAKDILKEGYPDPKTYYIIVDKYWQVVMVYYRKENGTNFGEPDYERPVRYMLCSTGNPKKEYGHETTSGTWPIAVPKVRFHQFVNLEAAQYLTLIHSRTYFHSVLYRKKGDLSSFVADSYTNLGTKASHACIRLTVPDSRWMFYNVGYGTTCEIRNGSKSDLDTGLIRHQLVLAPYDKTVKLSARNDLWDGVENWSIADVAHELKFKYQEPPMPDMGDGDDKDNGTSTPKETPGSNGNNGNDSSTWVTPRPQDLGSDINGDIPG